MKTQTHNLQKAIIFFFMDHLMLLYTDVNIDNLLFTYLRMTTYFSKIKGQSSNKLKTIYKADIQFIYTFYRCSKMRVTLGAISHNSHVFCIFTKSLLPRYINSAKCYAYFNR